MWLTSCFSKTSSVRSAAACVTEERDAAPVDSQQHAIPGGHFHVGINSRRNRVATNGAVKELVGAEYLCDLDLEVQARVAVARTLCQGFGANSQHTLLDSGSDRQLDVEARRLRGLALDGDRDESHGRAADEPGDVHIRGFVIDLARWRDL